MPGDNPAAYKTKLVDGQRQLAKGKDGNCIYLGPKGCKIHGRAPQMCRALDCRKWALQMEEWTPQHLAMRLSKPHNRAVLQEGRKRLGIE